ncbi:MAG: hypothetical protein PSN34_13985 [Urechidicola sp.]|nr:hypothetical protein [Urechidicola sp.]
MHAKEQAIGFDTYKPLTDFETLYNFTNSMRKDHKVAEDDWLNKPDLIEANDPDKFFYELDKEEMTVLNNIGAVKIGTSIFKVFDGGVAEITDGDIFTLNRIAYYLCEDFANETGSNVVIYGGCTTTGGGGNGGGGNNPPAASCFSDERDVTSWNTATRRKMKGIVKAVYHPLWGVKLKSRTKFYKKVGWVWFLHRSDLTATLDGTVDYNGDSNCGDDFLTLDETVDFTFRANKKRAKFVYGGGNYWADQKFLVENNHLKGVHKQDANRREQYLND